MPRIPLYKSSGTGISLPFRKSIRLARFGCTNRPFYHIVVTHVKLTTKHAPIEQLGTYDPMPNKYNEKLCSLNLERLEYWLSQDCKVTKPVADLLGLSGFLPISPRSFMVAWRNRQTRDQAENQPAPTPAEQLEESTAS